MKKLIPLYDKIVVKPIDSEDPEMTESGVILPDSVREQKNQLVLGEVIACSGMRIQVLVGDTVIYHRQAQAIEYELNGEKVLIMSEKQIISIIVDEKNPNQLELFDKK
tara:strand:+ start:460 stop:783 length:324 start_codon:yes stop_codon:yes gene_type:complete